MAEPARPLADLRILAAEALRVEPRPEASAEEQKRAFLRLVSHELRTPLNSILGFSEILACELYGPLGAPQYKEYAEIVRQSGQKLLELVNQLLELARLESGVSDLSLGTEALGPALEDALGALGPDAARIEVARGGELLAVTADAKGLRTVLANLLRSALRASPETAQVVMAMRRRGSDVEIAVTDAGEPVEPADLPRLLRPFESAEAGDGEAARGGGGLGLPTAALLCRAMGGQLALSAAPGAGVTATVRLPAA